MPVESLPSFTKPARRRWDAIAPGIRQRLLANVWCARCSGETTITDVAARIERRNLVLTGRCARCRHEVARLIEGE